MKHPVDISTWKRRDNYLFFRDFINPFYGLTVRMDVTQARVRARKAGVRFSQYLLYASLKAVNSIEELRYRQIGGQVWLFDTISLNTPIATPDHSFRSVVVPFLPSLGEFAAELERLRDAILRGEGDAYSADADKGTVCISIMPWVDFTEVSYQIQQNAGESIPLSNIGKMTEQLGRWMVPVAFRFHHGFVDGYQAGRYFDTFQHNLDTL